jgi:hypothetical protein
MLTINIKQQNNFYILIIGVSPDTFMTDLIIWVFHFVRLWNRKVSSVTIDDF